MKNKNGFIAMSLVYAFFILFVAVMLGLIVNAAHSRVIQNKLNNNLKEELEEFDSRKLLLTIVLNGGSLETSLLMNLEEGETITFEKPTKSGSVFTGWMIEGKDSSMVNNVFTMGSEDTIVTANWLSYREMFTYVVNGVPGIEGTNFNVIDDGNENWRIKFLTSGTFTPLVNMTIDAFLVGGGGGGGSGAGGGGGGGYTLTQTDVSTEIGGSYSIVIGSGGNKGTGDAAGSNGGTTTAFGYSALGGYGGSGWSSATKCKGGNGGSGGGGGTNGSTGGAGGNDGANGVAGTTGTLGTGQGTTTRAFADPTGTLYASGGGGGNNGVASNGAGAGGNFAAGVAATANTGGGGGGSGSGSPLSGGNGGSGIVVIRNHR